jgi:hypothetical protein
MNKAEIAKAIEHAFDGYDVVQYSVYAKADLIEDVAAAVAKLLTQVDDKAYDLGWHHGMANHRRPARPKERCNQHPAFEPDNCPGCETHAKI